VSTRYEIGPLFNKDELAFLEKEEKPVMQQSISYRDKAGFVIVKDQAICRFVSHSYAKEYDYLMNSGLYQALIDADLLILHTEHVLSDAEKIDHHKILLPEFIPCLSYPYEWSADQWKDMMLSFLRINSIALDFGMIIKDATPFNFTFYKGKCIFFDTLSFDFYTDGQPWIAYRQFCESMLGPLALIFFNNENWIKLLASSINGWELPFVSRNLPGRTYFNMPILLHIHWHSKYKNTGQQDLLKRSSLNKEKLLLLWDLIHRSVRKWKIKKQLQNWATYYDDGIESLFYLDDKTKVVTQWLAELTPRRAVDLGANNGKYSFIAALYSQEVMAVESDPACIDQLYHDTREKQINNITTILSDLAQPTPGVGWNNEERIPLLSRLNCDVTLALALIHHLAISKNIPLPFIAQLLASITGGYAIVEFVPRTDQKIQQMLANREDIFDDYTEENFMAAFGIYFELAKSHSCLSSNRKIFLWRKRG
jgi:hypothetical protein